MKKTILLFLIVLNLASYGQNPKDSFSVFSFKAYGYYPSGRFDTVHVKILASVSYEQRVIVVYGYVVEETYIYYGDKMPPGTYEDRKQFKCLLNTDKEPLSDEYTIWNYQKLKPLPEVIKSKPANK
jgi:hypothetical protein